MKPEWSWIRVGWLATVVLAAAAVGLMIFDIRSQTSAEGWLAHTLAVQRDLDSIEESFYEINAIVRMHVLTGGREAASDYGPEVTAAREQIGRLAGMMTDDPPQAARAAILAGRFEKRVGWWDGIMGEGGAGLDSAAAELATGREESELADTRRLIRTMFETEARLLLQRRDRLRELRQVTFWMQMFVGLVVVFQTGASYWLVRYREQSRGREQALIDQARAYYESIVATVRQPLLVLDRELRVVSANRAYGAAFQTSTAEAEGKSLAELAGGVWNRPDLLEQLRRVIAEDIGLDAFRIEDDFPGIGRRVLILQGVKIYRPGNHTDRVLLAMEDDTERQAAETELRHLNSELESFAYSVAHDLRAPLRAMQGFSEVLLEDYAAALDEKGRDYLQRISTAAARLNEMIGDLLAYSQLAREDIAIVPVALDQVVETARQQLAPELEARQAEVIVEGPLPTVLGHAPTLVQAVANLLTNAAKFVARGTRPRIRLAAEPIDGVVRLSVTDNGIGIPPEYHQRIFRVFERLHGQDAYPGTGVGLAIVAKAAERLGGRAGVESKPQSGSCFWIELRPAPGSAKPD